MNRIEEEITDNFTISHAKQTIESLLKKAKEKLQASKFSQFRDSDFQRFKTAVIILKDSLKILTATEKKLNNL